MGKIDVIKRVFINNKKVIENFSFLSILQIVNLLIPLVTYPYLIRVLGSELYGLVVFTQVVAGYFAILISFGFSTFGAKEISIHRDDKQKLSQIISNISFAKLVLLLIGFLGLGGYLFYVDTEYKWLYILAFWVCILDVVFPQWFFQGIEKMKFITLISLAARVVFVLLIFVLIKGKEDVLWFPISNLIGALVSGGVSFYLIYKEGVRFIFPSFRIIKDYVRESYHFFLSNVLIQIYVASNKLIIGHFLGMSALAYYDLAEKIVNLVRMPQNIISQVAFPRISATKSVSFVKKLFKISTLMNVVLYSLLFVFGRYLVLFLGGEAMLEALPVVFILGLYVPIVGISNVLGILILIPFGYKREFTRMTIYSVITYVLLLGVVFLMNKLSVESFAMINILTEVIVCIIAFYFVQKNKILKQEEI